MFEWSDNLPDSEAILSEIGACRVIPSAFSIRYNARQIQPKLLLVAKHIFAFCGCDERFGKVVTILISVVGLTGSLARCGTWTLALHVPVVL